MNRAVVTRALDGIANVHVAVTVMCQNVVRLVRTGVMDLELGATPELRNGPRRSIEHPFGLIIESLPIALVLTGPGGLIEIVNREAEVMFGYDRTELRGKSLDLLIPERFRARCVDLRRYFPTAVSAGMVDEGEELFGLRKD